MIASKRSAVSVLTVALASVCGLLLPARGGAQAPVAPPQLLPTLALHLLHDSLRAAGSDQFAIASALVARVQTEGLDRDEEFALAELYFSAGEATRADSLFQTFADGADLRARIALQRRLRIQMAARSVYAGMEKTIAAARRRLPAVTIDPWHFFPAVSTLAQYHSARGEHAIVVRLVQAEVRSLPLDGLFFSHGLPGMFLESFDAEGRRDEALEHLRMVRDAHLASDNRSTRGESPPVAPHRAHAFHRLEEALLRDLDGAQVERFLRGRLVGLLSAAIARARSR